MTPWDDRGLSAALVGEAPRGDDGDRRGTQPAGARIPGVGVDRDRRNRPEDRNLPAAGAFRDWLARTVRILPVRPSGVKVHRRGSGVRPANRAWRYVVTDCHYGCCGNVLPAERWLTRFQESPRRADIGPPSTPVGNAIPAIELYNRIGIPAAESTSLPPDGRCPGSRGREPPERPDSGRSGRTPLAAADGRGYARPDV